ncbi:MAG: hypothetical protein QOI47_1164, partial [Actinomycetota bacterium]|nr:hypothetical protein [Actinomycetota bacterium]
GVHRVPRGTDEGPRNEQLPPPSVDPPPSTTSTTSPTGGIGFGRGP